jgi:hypothetical protein
MALVEQDGGNDRMLDRLVVTVRTADDGSHESRVRDFIDPEFVRVDCGIARRALACRQEIER